MIRISDLQKEAEELRLRVAGFRAEDSASSRYYANQNNRELMKIEAILRFAEEKNIVACAGIGHRVAKLPRRPDVRAKEGWVTAVLPAGATWRSTHPSYSRGINVKARTIKVFDIYAGGFDWQPANGGALFHESDVSHPEAGRFVCKDAKICWIGTGGYWMYAPAHCVTEMTFPQTPAPQGPVQDRGFDASPPGPGR